jgi:hypothetical protein
VRPKRAQRGRGHQAAGVIRKHADLAEAFVAIEAEGEVIAAFARDERGHRDEAREIAVALAVDLDFEMPEPVGADALGERLRETVVHPIGGGEIAGFEWVGEADGVAGEDGGSRRGGQPLLRSGAGERGMNAAEIDPK